MQDRSEICIQAISVYGEAGVLARPLGHLVEGWNHGSGGSHAISAKFVASLSGYEVRVIQEWARSGEHFIKLDWTFPGHNYPKFTTRHTLDPGEASGDVSFSGGLDWAQRMLKVTLGLQLPSTPTSFPAGRVPLPALPPYQPYWSAGPAFPGTPTYKVPDPADDQASVCSELTSATTISDADGSCLSSDLASTSQPSLSGSLPLQDWTEDDLVQHQLQIDMLHRQRRDAEAMYANNGDTSGLLAVMTAASQSIANWDSFGMPRF
ncbi:hypothetical protein C8A03DRAFT_41096 [Achaetomium macrosporum]|uniref:Uncharacterized protein n=1 Tax=Achaetomium macrosporum TaxID=79813 RepID=A0AAN7CHM9_9PEZI|nr:hypothetical protein C8A03DRAFT_41096 [Achaetomium macrosporum]